MRHALSFVRRETISSMPYLPKDAGQRRAS